MMRTGVKFTAQPTAKQKLLLAQWAGCARSVYNAKVSEDRYFRKFRHHSLQLTGHQVPNDATYSHFKSADQPWLDECPSVILRNSINHWQDADARSRKGIGKRPTHKKKSNRVSITLTRELFTFLPNADGTHQLVIGNKKFPFGVLTFTAHRQYQVPNVIVLSRKNADYYISFSYEVEQPEVTSPPELLAHFQSRSEAELLSRTTGYDRGVVIPVQASDGTRYDFTPEQKKSLARLLKRLKREQQRLARQIRESKAQAKKKKIEWQPTTAQQRTRYRIADIHAKMAAIRHDFAHQVSHRITSTPHILLHVFEALLVQNMTRKPKAKQDANGKWLKNGARAKAGLNKAILLRCWGYILQYTTYKAERKGQMVITIPPPGTSQECAKCGHTYPDNRISQAQFACTNPACGHVANADENASQVIKLRGVKAILAGDIKRKPKKPTGSRIRKKKSDTPKVSIHNTPAGTRGSARRGSVRRKVEISSLPGADSMRREASSIGEPVNPATAAGEDTGVRKNLAGYQIKLFSRATSDRKLGY